MWLVTAPSVSAKVSTTYLFPSTLQGLADVSVSPGAGQDGYPLVWDNDLGRWVVSLLPYSSLTGVPILGTMADQNANAIAVTGGSALGLLSVQITGTTPSTSPITGALRVSGGVGVGGAVHAAGAIVAGNPNASTAQLDISGGAGGGAIVRLSRSVGAAISYSWNLAGGKLSFTNDTQNITSLQTSVGAVAAGTAEVNIGLDWASIVSTAGTPGLIKGSDSGGAGVNVAGGNLTICSGRGLGAAVPSRVIVQTPVAGSSGSTRQARADQLTITHEGITVAGAKVNLANLPTSSTGLAVGDVWRDGENLKVKI